MNTRPTIFLILTFAFVLDARADSATWNLDPANGDWNTAANWTPATVPNGPADIATFGLSHGFSVSVSATTEVNEIVFNSGASNFGITVDAPAVLTIGAGGVVNPGGTAEGFLIQAGASLLLQGNAAPEDNIRYEVKGSPNSSTSFGYMALLSANAGNGTYILDGGESSSAAGAYVQFHDASMGDNCSFTVDGGAAPFAGGALLEFGGTDTFPSAGNGQYTINGGAAEGARGGYADVLSGTTLETSTFTVIGGMVANAYPATLHISAGTTADRATLIAFGTVRGADGGTIIFDHDSLGGTSRIEVFFPKGNLDIKGHDAPGLTIGSLEGDGFVSLGSNNLTVGSAARNTVFAGSVEDGGLAGSLTKIGNSTLVLSGASSYSGGTIISKGTLLANNRHGSATGTGPVLVSSGARLGGKGFISGSVTVGTGSGAPAIVTPGANFASPSRAPLSILGSLIFAANGVYEFQVDSDAVRSDNIAANGVTIAGSASVMSSDLGNHFLTIGVALTLIRNTSGTPISGTFANLADGSTVIIGVNKFEVNYEGGDGNDLTLTVVPP